MFESKDCVLEMTVLNIMFALNYRMFGKGVRIVDVMNRVIKLNDRRFDLKDYMLEWKNCRFELKTIECVNCRTVVSK